MTDIESFYPFVLPFASGASDPAATQCIREACIEFCKRTAVVRQWLSDITLVVGTSTVAIVSPTSDVNVSTILEVKLNDKYLDPKSEDEMRLYAPSNDTPKRYFEASDTVLQLHPTPSDATYPLKVRACTYPSATCTQVDDQLFTRYRTQIAAGAIAALHMINEDWAKPAVAAARRTEFETHIANAAYRAARSNVRSRPRNKPNFL